MRVAYADPKVRISNELQIGKAAEHLVCADLIIQGLNAFLADQGLPYDIVVDTGRGFKTIQVKARLSPVTIQGRQLVYFYNNRRAKKGDRTLGIEEVDFFAFVALDRRIVAYMPSRLLAGKDGVTVVQCIQLRTRLDDGAHNGLAFGHSRAMRCFEDYARLPDA